MIGLPLTQILRPPCTIVQVIGTAACAMYRLRCKPGVSNKCYSACDLEFVKGISVYLLKNGKVLLVFHFEELQK